VSPSSKGQGVRENGFSLFGPLVSYRECLAFEVQDDTTELDDGAFFSFLSILDDVALLQGLPERGNTVNELLISVGADQEVVVDDRGDVVLKAAAQSGRDRLANAARFAKPLWKGHTDRGNVIHNDAQQGGQGLTFRDL
jgi:hypothetical protein